MKNWVNKLVGKNSSSLWTVPLGLMIQVATWPFLFIFGVANHLDERVVMASLILALSSIWLFIPVIFSIGGIIISIIQIHKRNVSKLPILGLILNIIWIILFLLAVYILAGIRV